MIHPVAGAHDGTDARTSPNRETTLRLLAPCGLVTLLEADGLAQVLRGLVQVGVVGSA